MIHHVSIPALDPRRVAGVLAELWGGTALPFPGLEGAYWAGPGDEAGTMVDVYPADTSIVPGTGDAPSDFARGAPSSGPGAFHLLIAVPASQETVLAVGAREGWRAVVCSRQGGAFRLIELWVENRLLVELITPEDEAGYRAFMAPRSPDGMFARALITNR
jgi:hypothetical protein